MRCRLRGTAVAFAVTAALAGTAIAQAGETERASYDLAVSTAGPGLPAGLQFHVLYKHPDDPESKPPAVTTAVFELPEGLRIDDGAVPQCMASDADFRLLRRDACPAESKVGHGVLTVMTGVAAIDPVATDVVAFNGPGQIIEVVFFKDTNTVAGLDRLTIEDGQLVAHPPTTPGGPPDGRTVVREIDLVLPPGTGTTGRPYITTPPACPDGAWKSRALFEFADGGSTVVPSESPCSRRSSLRIGITPRRVSAGERTKFRVVARSVDRSCRRAARVRIGRKGAVTNRRGRARLTARFRKPGRKRVVVRKHGCHAARTHIRVR